MAELDRANMGPIQGTEARKGKTHWPRPRWDSAFQRIYYNASLEEVSSKQAPIGLSFNHRLLQPVKLISLFSFSVVTKYNSASTKQVLTPIYRDASICYREFQQKSLMTLELASVLPKKV